MAHQNCVYCVPDNAKEAAAREQDARDKADLDRWPRISSEKTEMQKYQEHEKVRIAKTEKHFRRG